MKERCCKNCTYSKDPIGIPSHWCRRYPKVIMKDEDDYCGEYEEDNI